MADVVGVHLVGSAPVEVPEQIFELAMEHLGGRLRRIGDGEIGERDTWIRWQYPKLGESPQLERAHLDDAYRQLEQYDLVDGAGPLELVSPGYADAAIESYASFARLVDAGVIADGVRFMVGLPSPLSVVTMYVAPRARPRVLEAYTEAMLGELARIVDAIPDDRLSIQWEVCIEFGILEGLWTLLDGDATGDAAKPGIAAHIVALGDAVPASVELGYHLCYGDSGHQHFTQPADAGFLAWAAATLVERVQRPIAFIHLPVPRDRDDAAYFAPLSELSLPPDTELYLGLVHDTGGLEGTQRRLAVAEQAVDRFGVATECGLGRRTLESIPALLDQHATVAREYTGPRTEED